MITVANSKGYRCCTLGDVITLKRGYDLPHNQRLQGEVPVVSSSGITGRHDKAKVKAPGVVTGRYGTLGEVFYIEEDFWPLNTALYICDFKGNHPKFISYMLRTLGLGLQNAAGAVPGINRNVLHKIPITIPNIQTQQHIAKILSNYDRLIDNNNRRIALLEESIHQLYKEWFVRSRFPGYESVKVVDGIPEGWDLVNFTDIADVLSGGTPKTQISAYWDGNIPFFTPKDAPSSCYVMSTAKTITDLGLNKCNSKLYPKNTVFVTARGTVGKTVLAAVNMAMNQSCFALKGKEGINQYFLFLNVKTHVEYLRGSANGATFDAIIIDNFRRLKVMKPQREILDKFEITVEPIFKQVLILLKMNVKLQQARDLLLPRLMNGSIAV
ncbi:restriction endonuclease subunit S [uncultured Nostoc sp.]|uniref:restriction endonuclease subunit S n=1 Tax=uncultured Nostoc sp. TaxID=340711 RepID=UPI0035CC85B0